MTKIIIFILLSSWIYALPASINTIINKSGISKKDISIYIKEVDEILGERKRLTHRKIVKGKGSPFSSLILPLGGEEAKDRLLT